MPERQEVELKLRLEAREAYEGLCRKLGRPEVAWEQINHYFQSEDGRIPGSRGVIRIRLEKGKALLTVKLGALHNGLATAQEYEETWPGPAGRMPPSSSEIWETGHAGLKALEQQFGGPFPLKWVGSMANLRKIYRTNEGLCLEVDASRYPDGHEDYEVEVETDDPQRDRGLLEGLLSRLGIPFTPQPATKYQRFLQHRVQR